MGKSGRAILDALVDGEADPDKLLALVQRWCSGASRRRRRRCAPPCRDASRCGTASCGTASCCAGACGSSMCWPPPSPRSTRRWTAPSTLAKRRSRLRRFRQAVRLLRTLPGVSDLTAQLIVSEIGISRKPLGFADMSRVPTAGHLISWAGLCPRNDESAGKRRSTRLRKGAPWLKTTLVQCAWAGARKKASYLQAQFQRLRHRRGPKKAICAVAASILTAAYPMLRDGTFCQDLGPDHFRRASPEAQANRLARQITKLGSTCTLTPAQGKEVSV